MYVYLRTCIKMFNDMCVRACVCVCIYVRIWMFSYICSCVYLHILLFLYISPHFCIYGKLHNLSLACRTKVAKKEMAPCQENVVFFLDSLWALLPHSLYHAIGWLMDESFPRGSDIMRMIKYSVDYHKLTSDLHTIYYIVILLITYYLNIKWII